jgi:opacity protein-like surface antigen
MKKFFLATAAAIALMAAPAFAKTVQGCEVVTTDGANFSIKVDPNCQFKDSSATGSSSIFVDTAYDVFVDILPEPEVTD